MTKGFDLVKSRQNYDNLVYTGSSNPLNSEDVSKYRQRKWRFIIVFVAIVVVAAIVLGLVLGLKKAADDKNYAADTDSQHGDKTSKSTASPTMTSAGMSTTPAGITSHPEVTLNSSTESTSGTSATSSTNSPDSDWMSHSCDRPAETQPKCPWSRNPLLLVSLDGFRAEYLLRNKTPVIEKLRTCGVHTPFMRAAYPTLTFPNHYTIVTGLYPESHGIVGNSMYDPHINASFSMGGNEKFNPKWWGGEPLWVTAKKQGKKTASYFWVGSEMNISGYQPDYWKPYDGSVPYEERVDTVLKWLSMPDSERPDFMTLYMNEPDHTGHGHGPDSPEVEAMLGRVDSVIRYLMDSLYKKKLDECVNLIILADHGMEKTSCERQVALKTYVKDINKMLTYSGTTGYIHTQFEKNGKVVVQKDNAPTAEEVAGYLDCKNSHLHAFTRETIPVRHHYTRNDRIGNVVIDIESSWLFSPKASRSCLMGNHGYDNTYKSMHALFLAHGPGFKQNFETEPFENIELYDLMSELLELSPAPNNGTKGSLHHLLRTPTDLPTRNPPAEVSQCSNSGPPGPVDNCNCKDSALVGGFPSSPLSGSYPFGSPIMEAAFPVCRLLGDHFVTDFSSKLKMPVYTSYTLTSDQVKAYVENVPECWSRDPRVSEENDTQCEDYANPDMDLEGSYLYDPGFGKTGFANTKLSSNRVPMFAGFKKGIWSFLNRVIREYATKYGNVHVTSGPVFDFNRDGLPDTNTTGYRYVSNDTEVPIPTHYYTILMKCSQQTTDLVDCDPNDLDILSVVLPHKNHTDNCMPHKDFLINNVARIRDVEELTGLRFLTNLSMSVSARSRTRLPRQLWPSPLLTPWEDLPCPLSENATCPPGPKPLLLVSLDGFRADYLDRNLTPTIKRLSQCGVHTPYMRSVYPTVTFPNHYTIVTGLYPESHGIISNKMYDEEIDKIFTLSAATAKDPRWWKGEPLWITAKKYGLRTATYFWPGSDVNISGVYPDIWKGYDGAAGYSQRVYDVLDWITLPADERPHFITLYFDEPDHAGHAEGPVSEQVNGQLETVDELINILMTNLYEKGLHHCVNIIMVADHGMSPQSCEKTVKAYELYPEVTEMLTFDRVMGQLFPEFQKDNSREAHRINESTSVEDIVGNMTCKHSAMKVFTKDTLPRRHHYTNSPRIGDVLLDMEDSYLVLTAKTSYCDGGNHGWDNIYKNMHALFLAHGPAFRDNFTADPFENIELYNLMTEVLDIPPAPNNGTLGSLHHFLRNPKPLPSEIPTVTLFRRSSACNAAVTGNIAPLCGCKNSLTVDAKDVYQTNSVPSLFGEPKQKKGNPLCVLHQPTSSTGYSPAFLAPVWWSTVVSNSTVFAKLEADQACVLNDTRIQKPAKCALNTTENVQLTPLQLSGIRVNTETVYLSSTSIPMYKGFKEGVWQYMHDLIQEYTSLHGDLSVTMGAVYDYNNDGLWEGTIDKTRYADEDRTLPLPTHVYVTLIKCRDAGDSLPCRGDLDILPFILPHLDSAPNCQRKHLYLKDNVARIRDIELLTGMEFMTSYNATMSAQLRTFLPENIWPNTLVKDWEDLPCPHQDTCTSDYRPVLLISLDGFRADYLIRNFTPTIKRLSECGVHAPYMRSVYPTKTFPNHYSIVTGLYPESHGIIDNNMYDLDIGKRFYLGSETSGDRRWWGGEPIWLTAQRQGLKAATYFWPGSDVDIQGEYPDIWKKYDGSVPYSKRIGEVLDWMDLPADQRPDFITLYFDQPDLAGHIHGPSDEKAIGEVLEMVDETVHELMTGLMDRQMHNCVNLVIIADHGMADVSCDQVVRLRNHVDYSYLSSNTYVWEGAFGRIANQYIYNSTIKDISPVDKPADTAGLVSNLTCASPHLNVFTKESLPVRHHYTNNDRIDDLILDMDSGWLVTRSYTRTCKGGNHGYDNIDKSMEALFLAFGPAFKWNMTIDPFENIELYNMFADILNVTAAPNNGTRGSLNRILQSPHPITVTQPPDYLTGIQLFPTASKYAKAVQNSSCVASCNITSDSLQSLFSSFLYVDKSHVPFGVPAIDSSLLHNRSINLFYQETYQLGYDESSNMALWVSQSSDSPEAQSHNSSCIIPDPRLTPAVIDNLNCSNTPSMEWTSLAMKSPAAGGLEYLQSHLSSTFFLMDSSFLEDVWMPFQKQISEWSKKYGVLNVISGPVFDSNHDSIPDSLDLVKQVKTPSHFFTVISRCPDPRYRMESCPSLTTVSYILPHSTNVTLCKGLQNYLLEHEARVRDVELVTGLHLFTELPTEQVLQLRTFLPQGLWTSD